MIGFYLKFSTYKILNFVKFVKSYKDRFKADHQFYIYHRVRRKGELVMEPEEPAITGEHERTVSAPTSTQSTIREQLMTLPPPAREALLKELLITPQDIAVGRFCAIFSPTTKSLDKPARSIISHNTFFYHIDLIPEALKDQTGTWLKNGTIKVKDLVTKIKIYVDEHWDGSDHQTCTRLRELSRCTGLKELDVCIVGDKLTRRAFYPGRKIRKITRPCMELRHWLGAGFWVKVIRFVQENTTGLRPNQFPSTWRYGT